MAYAEIHFEHPLTKQKKIAPVGFSWTVLFFGWFPPLFRSHWQGFLILLLTAIITSGLSNFFWMFVYNKFYIKHLVSEGFDAKNATQPLSVLQNDIGVELPKLPERAES